MAELDDKDVKAFDAARTRYRSMTSTSDLSTALSALESTSTPTVARLRQILDLGRQYAAIEADIRSRLVERDAALLPFVVTLLLRSRELQGAAWIDELLSSVKSPDQFLAVLEATYKPRKPASTGTGCKAGCRNAKAKGCSFVRCSTSACADSSRSAAARAATAKGARVTDAASRGRRLLRTSSIDQRPARPIRSLDSKPLGLRAGLALALCTCALCTSKPCPRRDAAESRCPGATT